MSKKKTVPLMRDDEFSEVEDALAAALDQLEDANTRVEALLAIQASADTESDAEAAPKSSAVSAPESERFEPRSPGKE